jgi:nucleoside-diphosphate-sugar epimerase
LQSRDFTYVANVVNANLLACEREAAIGQVLNIACGERYTLIDLHAELQRILKVNIPPKFAPARQGEVKHSQAAIERAAQVLGYQPNVNWQAGLKRTMEWYREQARVV